MPIHADLPETDILKRVCTYFEKKGFTCRENVVVNYSGRLYGFDAICNSADEKVVLEVKRLRAVTMSTVQNIITLQKIPELKEHKFYLCIPYYSELLLSAEELLRLSGIGLVKVEKNRVKVVIEARSSRETVRKIFTYMSPESAKNLSSVIRMRKIETIVALETKPFRFRIAGELLEKLENLQNVAYSDLLREFKKDYESVDNLNDENRVVLKTLEKLWAGKYGKISGAKAFDSFDKFEPILKEIPRYRDHVIHPFQVFLMGTVIIDSNYDRFVQAHRQKFQNLQNDSVDFAWLLSSTFHDICYPIQMYEIFSKNFFQNFLQSEMSPIVFQTEKLLLENDNLKYLDQIVSLHEHYKQENKSWEFDSSCKINNKLRASMISEISQKNHALLSAMALIKKILAEDPGIINNSAYITGRFSTDVYPAALAIALHDEKMLEKLQECIFFEKMPLSFLLIYCDLIQECGRTEGEDSVELGNFDLGSKMIESTLKFVREQEFKNKADEMERIFRKISSTSMHFKLNLKYAGSTHSEDSFKNPC